MGTERSLMSRMIIKYYNNGDWASLIHDNHQVLNNERLTSLIVIMT